MGAISPFFRKLLRNGRDDSESLEIDTFRSVFPSTLESGFWAWGATSTVKTSILNVPAGKKLHLKHIMINNDDDVPNKVFFYDGSGTSVSVGPIQVNKSTTIFVDNIEGWIFQSAVHASLVTSLTQVRVGGLLASV